MVVRVFKLLAASVWFWLTVSSALAQDLSVEKGMAFYVGLRDSLQENFEKIQAMTSPIGQLRHRSELSVIVENIKGFRQIDLPAYSRELISYCDDLAARKSRIDRTVATTSDLRRNGPNDSQKSEIAVIAELRPYCLAPGNKGRKEEFWLVLQRLDQQSKTLFDEFQRRHDDCLAKTRCKQGIDNG